MEKEEEILLPSPEKVIKVWIFRQPSLRPPPEKAVQGHSSLFHHLRPCVPGGYRGGCRERARDPVWRWRQWLRRAGSQDHRSLSPAWRLLSDHGLALSLQLSLPQRLSLSPSFPLSLPRSISDSHTRQVHCLPQPDHLSSGWGVSRASLQRQLPPKGHLLTR